MFPSHDQEAGFEVNHYWAIEYERVIKNKLAAWARSQPIPSLYRTTRGDVLDTLASTTHHHQGKRWPDTDLFLLDFCGAMGPSFRSFMLPHILVRQGDCTKGFVLSITFCPRSPSAPVKKLEHSLKVIAPEFYGLDCINLIQNTYSDTSPMHSWLAHFRKVE